MRTLAIVHQQDAGPGVFAEALRSCEVELDEWDIREASAPADPVSYDAVLTFGGAMHADQEAEHPWLRDEKALLRELIERGVPVLGLCLGCQLLAQAAGATARRASLPEIGWYPVELTPQASEDPLLSGLPSRFDALQWHSYEATLPPDATPLARSPICLQAYRLDGPAWGIQFHAEVTASDADRWIGDYRSDPDAVGIGLDPEAMRRCTRARIASWNDLGRALCARFVEVIRG